jgi:LPXTG-motif cell wall-anchored protein
MGAAPLLSAVAGVQTLPSTSTERTNGLLGLGVAFMLIGGLLIRRKPITF